MRKKFLQYAIAYGLGFIISGISIPFMDRGFSQILITILCLSSFVASAICFEAYRQHTAEEQSAERFNASASAEPKVKADVKVICCDTPAEIELRLPAYLSTGYVIESHKVHYWNNWQKTQHIVVLSKVQYEIENSIDNG